MSWLSISAIGISIISLIISIVVKAKIDYLNNREKEFINKYEV